MTMELILEKWEEILLTVKEEHELTDISFNAWLKPLSICNIDGSKLYILVPSEQMGINYITKKYKLPIEVAIEEITGIKYELEFILPEQAERLKSFRSRSPEFLQSTEKSNLNPNYTFESFVVGKNNKFAHAASLAVAESPGEVYNPLYIYGGPGLGKTHLMQSIGHFILQQQPEKRVIYVTSEEFTNEVIDSIRNGNASAMTKLRDKYRTVDVLMIDDVQFIIGKESTQEEFFHTFNVLHSAGKQIILSSDKPPKEMETLEERIRSRFEWGLLADIGYPDYETRMAILRRKQDETKKGVGTSVDKCDGIGNIHAGVCSYWGFKRRRYDWGRWRSKCCWYNGLFRYTSYINTNNRSDHWPTGYYADEERRYSIRRWSGRSGRKDYLYNNSDDRKL